MKEKPATAAALKALEKHFGFALPPSYRAWLEQNDGAKNFFGRISLLSTQQHLQKAIGKKARNWEKGFLRLRSRTKVKPLAIGLRLDGPGVWGMGICFDVARKAKGGELRVIEVFNDGTVKSHPNFKSFLRAASPSV